MKTPSILVSGNTTLDIITICDMPYNLSGKRTVAEYKQIPGGQAANVADLLANLGNNVSFVGAIGNDEASRAVTDDFNRAGIEVSHSAFCEVPHHLGFVRVDRNNGDRFIDMYRDPKLVCDKVELPESWLKGFDCIYFDNHEPALAIRLGQLGRKLKIPVVADLEEVDQYTNDILPYVDVLIAPAKIIQQIAKTEDVIEAALTVHKTGFAAIVATMGAQGCVGFPKETICWTMNGLPVEVKDTTGAGDAFHAAFVHSMLSGSIFPQCLTTANEIAATKCTFLGPRIPSEIAKPLTPQKSDNVYVKERWLRNERSAFNL